MSGAGPPDGDPAPGAPRLLGRLRTRVALASAVAALIALVVVGVVVLATASSADRSTLDRSLTARADQAATVGRRTVRATGAAGGRPAVRASRRVGRLLGPVTGGADVALIRIVRGGTVLDVLGATADPGLPADAPRGPATVATPEGRWRIAQRSIGRGIVVQAASPLAAIDERSAALRDRLLLAGAGGVLATGLLAFLLAGPALGALTRLRRDAGVVASTADLDVRMPEDDGPAEVRELAGTLNAMLARLAAADADRRAALATTQRFAADAGHELRTPLTALTTTVEALRAHPDLPAEERETMLTEVAEEQARLVALLDALQALARGDAGARLQHGPVDLAELAEQAVAAARAAAPGATIALDAPPSLVIDGWAPGLRLLLDNLVANAVRHGRPGGRIVVTVAPAVAGDSGRAAGGTGRAAGRPGAEAAGPAAGEPGAEAAGPGAGGASVRAAGLAAGEAGVRAAGPAAGEAGVRAAELAAGPPGADAAGRAGPPDATTTGGALLLVDDDGPGVPPEERAAVLERFARGRCATAAGSGLGLALVDQQARLHGGRLTLDDAPAGGLRARVTLG